MKVKKHIKNLLIIAISIAAYIGFFVLVGYAWDNSPTVRYQEQISERGQR